MRSPLKCSHEIEFPAPVPVPGDSVYCYKCRDYSTVLPRHIPEHSEPFYVRCMHTPKCRYRRYYSKETYARSLAECHLRRTGHAVEIYLNVRPAMILFGRVMIHENAVTYARYISETFPLPDVRRVSMFDSHRATRENDEQSAGVR